MTVTVEICLEGIDSALAADAGGANRIELCQNLGEGGTTPSQGMIACVNEQVACDVMVMIRPRGGDFLYTDAEFAIMQADIKAMHQHGVLGVVFGLLLANGRIDTERTQRLIDLARPMQITLHRAFDMSRNPFEALDDLLALGVDRVLTSGQAPSAIDGLETIKKLQQQAGDALAIMPAGGITAVNAKQIIAATGVRELHLGSAVTRRFPSQMQLQNQEISMGSDPAKDEYAVARVSAALVQEVVTAVHSRC